MVAAAAMVAGAVAVRSRVDGDDPARAAGRLMCASELDGACERLRAEQGDGLAVVVEPAGVTAERLATASGDPGLDGWLVSAPWPEIVDGRRRAEALPPLFPSAREGLARSPLVLVAWKDRLAMPLGALRFSLPVPEQNYSLLVQSYYLPVPEQS